MGSLGQSARGSWMEDHVEFSGAEDQNTLGNKGLGWQRDQGRLGAEDQGKLGAEDQETLGQKIWEAWGRGPGRLWVDDHVDFGAEDQGYL